MAHGDYDCCAICNRKMAYNAWDSRTKEEICGSCTANMAENGVILHDVKELLAWVKNEKPEKVKEILQKVGYRKCFYQNPVDDEIIPLLEE